MKKAGWVCLLFLGFVLSWSLAIAGDFYVIPTQKKNFAPVAKTGQTTSDATGDDGYFQKGVAWPSPRFTDNGNGTVTDNLTGLIWMKDSNCFGSVSWGQALSDCAGLANGGCSLTDDSVAGDWRLPNIKELQSLIDYGRCMPAFPSGHPFINEISVDYWSSSTGVRGPGHAWYVNFYDGYVFHMDKTDTQYVRCVRSGN